MKKILLKIPVIRQLIREKEKLDFAIECRIIINLLTINDALALKELTDSYKK